MVSLLGPLGAFNLATRLQLAISASALDPTRTTLSLRGIERLTGASHQRLSEFLRDPGAVTPARLADMVDKLSGPGLQRVVPLARTIRIDAPVFTRASIAALQPPPGARGLAFVYESNSYAGGIGQTILSDTRNSDPVDALELVPGGVDAVRSVLWYVG